MEVIAAEEIQRTFSMKEAMKSIESFYSNNEGSYISPERMHVDDEGNTALLMPAFHGDYYAVKLVGVAPGNTDLGKDTIHGLMVLHDRKTMEPIFMCDAIAVTALRTGALGGLGMKYLATKKADTLGVIGTGTQGWSHLQAALVAREIKDVHIFNRTESKAYTFKERAEEVFPEIRFHVTDVEELVKQSDIIVTTTTSSEPVLPELSDEEWKGKLVVGVGSFRPSMQEIPDQILKEADEIHVDADSAITESGDMIRTKEIRADMDGTRNLERIIMEDYFPERTEERLILFKTVGASIFDLVTVRSIYETYFK